MALPDLHMVHFAVPYPADYGGAIDSWNRLYALKQSGLNITLHCFVYADFKPQPALKEVAGTIHYYPRKIRPSLFAKGMPYIVSSRKSPGLLKNLLADTRPVLFEGMHTTAFLPELTGRKLLLRAHNIEYQYYRELSRESTGMTSLFYTRESNCLEAYEASVARALDVVFAISPGDREWFSEKGAHAVFLPPFHGYGEVTVSPGKGRYLLYQGDLSLEINQNALLDLLKRLPPGPGYPLVVAGRSGHRAFEQKLSGIANLQREADVSKQKMQELIQHAHIILIHSLHGSGMKLKLFPALYQGKYIMATPQVRTYTPLDNALHFYEPDTIHQVISELWPSDFTEHQVRERAAILSGLPDDMQKAKEITRYL